MCTLEYHPNNHIIEDLGHSWGTSLRIVWLLFFYQGFNKASNLLGNLVFFCAFNANMAI